MAIKSYALTTVERAANFIGISVPSSNSVEESLLERFIDGVTELIEGYLQMRVMQTAYSNQEYDTEDGDALVLEQAPVSSTASFVLQRRQSGLNEDNWETVDGQNYHVDLDAGIIYAIRGSRFAQTRRGYRVSYTAGFDFDNSATFLANTEAGDLELAAWMMIATMWGRRRGGVGIKSEKIGDYAVTYEASMLENPDIKVLLDKYARIDIPIALTPIQV